MNLAKFGLVTIAAISLNACGGIAITSAKDGHYSQHGISFDPNSNVVATGNTAVAYKREQTIGTLAEQGRLNYLPGMTGSMVTNQSFYGNMGVHYLSGNVPAPVVTPPASAPPASPPAAAPEGSEPVKAADPVTARQLALVLKKASLADEKANAALETLERLRARDEKKSSGSASDE